MNNQTVQKIWSAFDRIFPSLKLKIVVLTVAMILTTMLFSVLMPVIIITLLVYIAGSWVWEQLKNKF